jgi:hypothetical protein
LLTATPRRDSEGDPCGHDQDGDDGHRDREPVLAPRRFVTASGGIRRPDPL